MNRTHLPIVCIAILMTAVGCQQPTTDLRLSWDQNILTVHGDHLPDGKVQVWYLEAYCRPGARDQPWDKTTIGHTTELLKASADGKQLQLRCTLKDGVTVLHKITASSDEVDFQLSATNPTDKTSEAHWAQPCIRVGAFTGTGAATTEDKYAYIKRSFVFQDGKQSFMPTPGWSTQAQYTPGQVWIPKQVPRADANPRPHHPHVTDNGLIGCVSADKKWVLATAWAPYQELFQGVIRCLHSDFRIGGLKPGQSKTVRGKLYILPNNTDALLKRYHQDFPKQSSNH